MIARMTTKTLALTTIALPLALGLASCGSNDDAETALNGEPVAAVPAPEGQEWSEIAEMTARAIALTQLHHAARRSINGNNTAVGGLDALTSAVEYPSPSAAERMNAD